MSFYVDSDDMQCKPSPFGKQFFFVRQIQLASLYISHFKVTKRKYFSQGKCNFMKLLFVLWDKIKILSLQTVNLPHQYLHVLFLTPLINFWGICKLTVENMAEKMLKYFSALNEYLNNFFQFFVVCIEYIKI
jgi:hypothetical protein